MTNSKIQTDQGFSAQTSRLTVEVFLWVLMVGVAFALRLARLGAIPLSAPEASQALLAWRASVGQGLPLSDYSPLLFTLNFLGFTLRGGATDALARLWPALFGGTLTLAPLLLRRRLGRGGALGTGLCLTISPTMLFASRQVDGTIIAALGAMLCLGGWMRLAESSGVRRCRWLIVAAGGLALAVTSSASAYGLLFPMGLAWVLVSWIWPSQAPEDPSPESTSFSFELLFVLYSSLFVLVLSTMVGGNVGGLGAAGDLLARWFAKFGTEETSMLGISPLALLVVYEPLALVFGLAGGVLSIQRRDRFGMFLVMWAGIGSLLLLASPGWVPLDVVWAGLPLILLAGLVGGWLVQDLRERGSWLNEGLHVPVVVILWIHCGLMLAGYTISGTSADLALALLTVALQGLLMAVFAMAMNPGAALRATSVGTGLMLFALTFAAAWGVAHARPSNPRELLVRKPTAVGVGDLTHTLQDFSWRETGLPTTLSFLAEVAPDSSLAWYLRDFDAARWIDSLEDESIGGQRQVVVTARRDLEELTITEDIQAVGQDFVVRHRWDPRDVRCTWTWPPQCQAAIKWWLFRETNTSLSVDQQVVMWVLESDWETE